MDTRRRVRGMTLCGGLLLLGLVASGLGPQEADGDARLESLIERLEGGMSALEELGREDALALLRRITDEVRAKRAQTGREDAVKARAPEDPGPVADALDALHRHAAEADGEAYFALFAPDAIFYGTDATERWSKAEFQEYAAPIFGAGRGWTYAATERHVYFDDAGDTAWFDERLHNEKYGEVRGTGVLRRRHGDWRIVQYNLTFPVPNDVAPALVELIRGAGR